MGGAAAGYASDAPKTWNKSLVDDWKKNPPSFAPSTGPRRHDRQWADWKRVNDDSQVGYKVAASHAADPEVVGPGAVAR
eukprot:5819398-Pyramimonas_sp.AAC.1